MTADIPSSLVEELAESLRKGDGRAVMPENLLPCVKELVEGIRTAVSVPYYVVLNGFPGSGKSLVGSLQQAFVERFQSCISP